MTNAFEWLAPQILLGANNHRLPLRRQSICCHIRRGSGGHVDALDNLCNSFGFVVARAGKFVHPGWIHPHTAGVSAGGTDSAISFRTQIGSMTIAGTGSIESEHGHNLVPQNEFELRSTEVET